MLSKNLEIQKKAVPLHSVISFSVINYVVSMRGPHVSGDNLFFFIYLYPSLAARNRNPYRDSASTGNAHQRKIHVDFVNRGRWICKMAADGRGIYNNRHTHLHIHTKRHRMDMKGKTILITGAGSGIGAACAMKFAAGGCRLILNGRNTGKLEATGNAARERHGAEVFLLPFDVRDRKAMTDALRLLPEEWKEIDVLVNNAGLALGMDKESEGSLDDWETVIDTNIKGTLSMTRLIVPGMIRRGHGHVINIGSIAGDAAYPGGSVYCASKAAVKTLSDGLRIDLADTPVRVTCIKPGQVETNFSMVRFHGDRKRADNVYKGYRPLAAEDIAETVWFAASAPEHVQIAEMLVLPTCQATATIIHKE